MLPTRKDPVSFYQSICNTGNLRCGSGIDLTATLTYPPLFSMLHQTPTSIIPRNLEKLRHIYRMLTVKHRSSIWTEVWKMLPSPTCHLTQNGFASCLNSPSWITLVEVRKKNLLSQHQVFIFLASRPYRTLKKEM